MRNELGINPVLWYSLVGVREGLQSAVTRPGSRPPGRTTVVTVSGSTLYVDDSPHPTPLEPADGQTRLVKTSTFRVGQRRQPWTRPSVGYRPEAGNVFISFFHTGKGSGGTLSTGSPAGHMPREGHREMQLGKGTHPAVPSTCQHAPSCVRPCWYGSMYNQAMVSRALLASHAHVIRVG